MRVRIQFRSGHNRFSITGLRELLSNFRVSKGNLKLSNNSQIWRSLSLFKIPEARLNAVKDGHTQVKEKDDCSGSFTVGIKRYQVTKDCKHLHHRVCLPKIDIFYFCSRRLICGFMPP